MMRSLRSRLILASLLWTCGLLAVIHVFSVTVMHMMPQARGIHAAFVVVMGMLLMVGGLFAGLRALAPFRRLRGRLADMRRLHSRVIDGAYPSEIQPLVDDLNALIADREAAVQRAVSTAGDLAHGLKTPLAVLSQEADRAAASGDREAAARIAQQVQRMLHQVDYHLARARAAPGVAGAPPCPVAPCAAAVVRTLRTLYAARSLQISAAVDPGLRALVRREDLEEMLGNLMDNACKWAKTRIVLEASAAGSMLAFTVDDDGAGLAPDLRHAVLQRGVRLDQAAPGSGLGLAIVSDLAALYSGSICLEDSPLGGLRARLRLPAFEEPLP